MGGRKYYSDGELFAYDLLSVCSHGERPDGTPLFREKFIIDPAHMPLRDTGMMGDYDVFANVLVLTPPDKAAAVYDATDAFIDPARHLAAGITHLPSGAGLLYTRVPARDYRFWQVFEIAVFLEGKLLCHARIVAAHFGEFGCCARANESHGAAVHGEPLHVAVSVDVGTAAGQDVDAGHVGELLVEIELLLHDERRAAVEFAQEAASVPVKFEAEVEIAVFA